MIMSSTVIYLLIGDVNWITYCNWNSIKDWQIASTARLVLKSINLSSWWIVYAVAKRRKRKAPKTQIAKRPPTTIWSIALALSRLTYRHNRQWGTWWRETTESTVMATVSMATERREVIVIGGGLSGKRTTRTSMLNWTKDSDIIEQDNNAITSCQKVILYAIKLNIKLKL